MKKIFACCLLIAMAAFIVTGTEICHYRYKYILDKMPDYKQAQKQLDDIAADWQKEIDAKQAALDKMYKDYDAEQVMLSDDLKKKREISCF